MQGPGRVPLKALDPERTLIILDEVYPFVTWRRHHSFDVFRCSPCRRQQLIKLVERHKASLAAQRDGFPDDPAPLHFVFL